MDVKEYHKINSIFKRDEKTKRFIIGEFARTEFEFLKDCQWIWDEKIDGTNIRVLWDGKDRKFGGRTENAQIPAPLFERLEELFTPAKLLPVFGEVPALLYGEGFGAKIQNGSAYLDHPDFILFDVLIGDYWLERDNIEGIATNLGLRITPVLGKGTIEQSIEFVRNGFKSTIGTAKAEGLVLRPPIQLFTRKGERIITKIKTKDFNTGERP